MIKINRIPIKFKLIIMLLSINLIVGIGITVFIRNFTFQHLIKKTEEKGISLGYNLSSDCIEPIIMDDRIGLQKLIYQTKKSDTDIYYIFILNQYGEVLVHTFGGYFPKGLNQINSIVKQPYHMQLISTEIGLIRDLSIPILNGWLGTVHLGISEQHVQSSVSSITKRLITILFTITILSLMLIYLFTKKTLSPLDQLIKSIQKVGEGDLHQKIEIISKDEIGFTIQTFNEMIDRLRKTNQELERTQTQLIQSAKMATVGQFSAGLAHEINNPLAGTLNCVRTLLANPEIKGQDRGYLELTLKGLLRIENIIRQILSFSMPRELETKLLNINKLIEETLSFVEPSIREKRIILKKNLPAENILISGDANLLQVAFLNILNNALDALHEGGQLYVEIKLQKENIEIKFIDNGVGIKKEHLDKIFDPFFTTKEPGKGTGIGLYFTYNFIQQHRGSINVDSIEGEGTTVTVILPVVRR